MADITDFSSPPQSSVISAELEKRLDIFRRSDQEREQLLHHLLNAYQSLEQKYNLASSDLANETSSRRHWQEQASKWQTQAVKANEDLEAGLALSQKERDSSPYIAVLIDGDGAPFLDELYALGEEGGSDAASRLNEELARIKGILYPQQSTSHWNIVVTIFMNMEGMSKKLLACGLLNSPTALQKFCRAFSRNQPLFQIVDVGSGKEQADYKLREWFRFNLGIIQCKHIILGGICHDTGYLPMLEPYKHDDATCKRLSLLATLPAQAQYRALERLKPVRTPTVFRSEHLPAKPTYNENGMRPSLDPSDSVMDLQAGAVLPIHSPTPSEMTGGSWAAVSKADDEKTKEINVASSKKTKRKYILLNAQQQRLDVRLPAADKVSQDKLNRRVKEVGKVCNYYHLAGKCKGGCGFTHGERLPEGEINALRQKARTRACISKGSCRDIDCTFGHVCPYGNQCHGKSRCAFGDVHDTETLPTYKWFEDDQIEHLL